MSGGDIVEFESRRSRGDDEDLVSIEKKKNIWIWEDQIWIKKSSDDKERARRKEGKSENGSCKGRDSLDH